MSFGGGSQGTIRYSVVLDTLQADPKFRALNQQFTQMKQQLTTLQTTYNSFNTAINTNARNFQASLNPIKAQGNALTNLNTNLKANSTQLTGLGTKIKDTASKYGTFAVGLGSTAAQVANLGRNYRDLNDRQIQVDRTARRVSVAQEQVDKTTRKINELQKQGKTNTQAYADAQRDLVQAQQNLAVNTQLLGERQEDLADFQMDFAINTIPTLITAVGTAGVAFKELGLNGGKLKGVFSILGTAISGLISNFTGVARGAPAAATGITALGGASTTATGAVSGLKAALIGIAGPLAALAAGAVIGNQLGAASPEIVKFRDSVDSSAKSAADALGPFTELFNKYREFIITTFPQFATEAEKASVGLGKVTTEGEKGIKWISVASAETNELNNVWAETNRIFGPMAGTIGKTAVSLTDLSGSIKETSTSFDPVIKQLKDARNGWMFLHGEITATVPPLDDVTKGFQQGVIAFSDFRAETTVNVAQAKSYRAELITWATQEAHISNAISLTTDELNLRFRALHGDIDAQKELFNVMNPGIAKFKEFVAATAKGTLETAQYRVELEKWATEQFGIADATKKSTTELELQMAAIKGNEQAIKTLVANFKQLTDKRFEMNALFDVKDSKEQKDKMLKKLIKMLPDKVEKKIETDLKFSTKVEAAKESFQTFLTAALVLDDKSADSIAKTTIKMIDDKFKGAKGPFANLREQIKASIADPNTPEALRILLSNFDWNSVGIDINTQLGSGIGSTEVGVPVIPDLGGGGSRFSSSPFFATIQQKAAELDPVAIPITTDTDEALGMLGELKRAWDKVAGQIAKQVPKISINPSAAQDAIGETKRGWDKAAGQIEKKIPKIKINADQALDMIGEVKRGMDKLKDKTVTIHIKRDGAVEGAQHGMHKTLMTDTLIQAHKGERVDIGPGSKGSGSGASSRGGGGSGFGGGDVIVNVNMMNETFVRKTKMQMGTQRFIYG